MTQQSLCDFPYWRRVAAAIARKPLPVADPGYASTVARLAGELNRVRAANRRWQAYTAAQHNRASHAEAEAERLRGELRHIAAAASNAARDFSDAGAVRQAAILRGFADRANQALGKED